MFLYEFKVQKTSLLMKNFSLCRPYKKVKHTICENESNNRLNLIIKTSESLILVYYDKVFFAGPLNLILFENSTRKMPLASS